MNYNGINTIVVDCISINLETISCKYEHVFNLIGILVGYSGFYLTQFHFQLHYSFILHQKQDVQRLCNTE